MSDNQIRAALLIAAAAVFTLYFAVWSWNQRDRYTIARVAEDNAVLLDQRAGISWMWAGTKWVAIQREEPGREEFFFGGTAQVADALADH